MKKEHFITPGHYQLIEENEAKFILEHAEKQLKDVLDTNSLIIGRTTTLLTILVGLSTGLFGLAYNRYSPETMWAPEQLAMYVACLYLLILNIILLLNLLPKLYYSVGAEPKEFFVDDVFNKENKDYRLIAIYVNEIIEYQFKIKNNKAQLEARWDRFNLSIKLLFIFPYAVAIIYLITVWLT